MRITLFGASGKTGQAFIKQALEEGNEVTAFVRSTSRLKYIHPHLHLVEGDIHDPASVARAIEGADAVVSTLGIKLRGKKDILESAAWTIIAGMRSSGVKRLVTLTNSTVQSPDDKPRLLDKILRTGIKVGLKPLYKDSSKHADILNISGIDWTIVRAHLLTDGPQLGDYKVGFVGSTGTRLAVSRADIADFILQELGEQRYIRRMPLIHY